MKRSIVWIGGLLLSGAALSACTINNGGAGGSSSNGSTSASGVTSSSGGAGSTSSKSSSSSNSTGTSMSSSSSAGGGGPIGACATTSLFEGDPYFNGDLSGWNPAGQALLADPPLRGRHLAVSGGTVYVDTQTELWFTDGANVKRAAGDENELDPKYQPSGACSSVRFLTLQGVTALPNGHLVVADSRGGGVVEISDPNGNCTATPIAGNMVTTLDTDITDVGNPGDVDGPGASAKFFGVSLPVSDSAGNVYVVDTGNEKIKKISADAAHTVTTLASYGSADAWAPMSMTVLNGKLYVAGASIVKDFLWSLDTTTPGAPTVIFEKTGNFAEIDSSTEAIMTGLDNDGTDLLVGSNKGYVFRMSTTGTELAVLAGTGPIVDYPTVDFSMPVPSNQLPYKPYGINDGSLVRMGNDILWAGSNGPGYYVFKLSCQ